ncbi:MAG: tetratricopeptide repeat protein [Opitutaceae bacterium]|nr:tetratricopeptide repeat protein [Opitutaceae bacterium]
MTPPPSAPAAPHLARARELVAEGRETEAVALLERHASPDADGLHRAITTRAATTALQSKEIAAATAWLDRGLTRSPADPTLNFFRGNLHQDSGHTDQAIACFRRCVAADAGREEFVCNLAHALLDTGALEEVVALCSSLPGSATAQLNLGAALDRQGRLLEAAAAFERTIALQPESFAAWLNLGGVRDRLNDSHAALAAYNRAVALHPTSARAHLDRGHTFIRLKRHEDAVASFTRALQREPDNIEAHIARASARLRLCDWTDLPTLRTQVVEPILRSPHPSRLAAPFFLLTLPGLLSQQELATVAADRARRVALASTPLRAGTTVPAGRPLRIGYVSPDFGNHAVGNCLRSLFARHDRSRVSVHAFSLLPHTENEYSTALRAGVDTWDELHALGDREAAERIAAREIDVLVDLAGHTKDNRLQLFAWRPAPVQVAWLGYPGTTGAASIDWILADTHLIPPSEEHAFTEKILRLPGSYLPTDDAQTIATGHDTRAEHGLPETGTVFCAFNNTYKIEPLIFGAWMEILRRTPGSVLWLRQCPAPAAANLRREAETRGIAPPRLLFETQGLSKDLHLARLRAADLYLDTHFYNAHSTAADALRAGLPVLTLPGQTFPSRVGVGLLTTLGLTDELLAASLEDYVERAVRFAAEPERLRSVRARLGQAVAQPGGLFDTAAFARKLETAYARVCSRHP